MKGKKSWLRKITWLLLVSFIIANCIAFFHAWKFTHFDPDEKVKTSEPEKLSLLQKIGILLTGVDLPRPENSLKPQLPYQEVWLQSNRKINCWLISHGNPKGTILVFHGYGGQMSSMLDKADIFYNSGYNVLLVDFMGSGKSEGDQTTIGYMEAHQVKSAVRFIRDRGEANVILFGTSMGAVAIMRSISELGVMAEKIIIECPFGTMLQTVKNRFSNVGLPSFPLTNLLTFWGGVQNGFNAFTHNPQEYAKGIKTPVLIFYGQKDLRVTSEEINSIYKNFGGWKKLVNFPNAGHENYLNKYRKEWSFEIDIFLDSRIAYLKITEPTFHYHSQSLNDLRN